MRAELATLVFYGAVAALPVSAGLFRVWVQNEVVRQGYALTEQVQRREHLQEELRALDMELAAERTPAKLAALAARLGLQAPDVAQVVRAASPSPSPSPRVGFAAGFAALGSGHARP